MEGILGDMLKEVKDRRREELMMVQVSEEYEKRERIAKATNYKEEWNRKKNVESMEEDTIEYEQ